MYVLSLEVCVWSVYIISLEKYVYNLYIISRGVPNVYIIIACNVCIISRGV